MSTPPPDRTPLGTTKARQRLTRLGALAFLALLAVLAALLPAVPKAPDAPQPPEASDSTETTEPSVSVLETGAEPNDEEDDLHAFEEAVERAKSQGRAVAVPPGTFHLSDVLVLDGVVMRGAGREHTQLISTDISSGSVDLTGSEPALLDLRHVVPGVTDRSPEPGRQNINVKHATSFRISGVHATAPGVRACSSGIAMMVWSRTPLWKTHWPTAFT